MAFSTAPLSLTLFNTPLQYRRSHPQALIVLSSTYLSLSLFFFFGKPIYLSVGLSVWVCLCVGVFVWMFLCVGVGVFVCI